jgi:MFS family permease
VPGRAFYGWYVAVIAVVIYFFTNGLAVFVPQSLAPRLMESFGASAGEIGRTTLISFAIAACLAPVAGALVDRLGVLRVLRVGLLILAASFVAYPLAQGMMQLYVIHAGFGVGLACAGLMVNVVLLSRWFVARRGLVVGCLTSGSSLAGALLPLGIAPWVNDPDFGWRWGYGALALLFLLVALAPGMILLREGPEVVGQNPDGAALPPPAGGTGGGVSLATALRSRTLWCLALGSACLWFSIQAVTSQVTIFLEREAGYAPIDATRLFSLTFGMSFVGKLAYGTASDWFAKRKVMLVASLTLLAGCLLLFEPGAGGLGLTRDPARLTAFAVVFGLGFGGSFTMIQLTVVESFGQRELGRILGLVTFIDALGAGVGPAIAGQLATTTGSYLAPFGFVTAVAVIAVANVMLIRPLARA